MSAYSRTFGFLHDIVIVLFSIGIAILLVQSDMLGKLLVSVQNFGWLGSFIAGFFFTSVFTTAPAIVMLGEIARTHAVVPVAILGAVGAVIGDLIIFRFIRDTFSEHLLALAGHRNLGKRLRALLRMRLFRWMSFFVGGLIIASPLPDELGISLFGFSKLRTSWFIPLSFLFNFAGILLIGIAARAI
jgi:hypothetical protein